MMQQWLPVSSKNPCGGVAVGVPKTLAPDGVQQVRRALEEYDVIIHVDFGFQTSGEY